MPVATLITLQVEIVHTKSWLNEVKKKSYTVDTRLVKKLKKLFAHKQINCLTITFLNFNIWNTLHSY